jgi:hypothetical protein
MFNRLPGTMLDERHTHECEQGLNCGRALLHDTAATAQSHRLFNPAQSVAVLDSATTFNFWLRGQDSNLHAPGQSRLSWPVE